MLRTWGRITDSLTGKKTWVEVTTDAKGFDDWVWLTTLVQCLKLNLNESPFYANYGIPAKQSVVQQLFPDYYVSITQQQFAPYFANLIIAKQNTTTPTYNINVVTNFGVKIAQTVAPTVTAFPV